jgi:membrane fusion protein, macrolide-specific efflux system
VPLNSYVVKGQILGETVSSVLPDRAVQSDDADLSPDEASFAVAQAQEDIRQAEVDLEAARASETDAEVQQVLAKDAERAAEQQFENGQFREGEVSAARYDYAVLPVDSALAAVDAARSQAGADAYAVSEAGTRLQEARARLAEAERKQELALAATEGGQESGRVAVVSPADGLLVDRDPIAGTLGICTDPSVLRVETWIAEDDLLKLRVGQPAWVSLDAEPQIGLRATVSEIAEEPIESPNGTIYPVALSVDNPKGLLLAGEKVHIRPARPESSVR